eukprot:669913_1
MATYSYIKNGKVSALKDSDLTDVETSSEDEEPIQQQDKDTITFWLWESDNGYVPYETSVSQKLDQLNINEVYELTIHHQRYSIKKIRIDEAIQTNPSGYYRKVIRRSNDANAEMKQTQNTEQKQHIPHKQVKQHKQHKNPISTDNRQLPYMWFIQDMEDASSRPCGYDISLQLNGLVASGLYETTINGTQYLFTKIADDICQQRNIYTNNCRTVIRKSVHVSAIDNHNTSKWYWVTDLGQFEPLSADISCQLDGLQIDQSITVNIGNGGNTYNMKKIANDCVLQTNMQTGNKRQVQKQ